MQEYLHSMPMVLVISLVLHGDACSCLLLLLLKRISCRMAMCMRKGSDGYSQVGLHNGARRCQQVLTRDGADAG